MALPSSRPSVRPSVRPSGPAHLGRDSVDPPLGQHCGGSHTPPWDPHIVRGGCLGSSSRPPAVSWAPGIITRGGARVLSGCPERPHPPLLLHLLQTSPETPLSLPWDWLAGEQAGRPARAWDALPCSRRPGCPSPRVHCSWDLCRRPLATPRPPGAGWRPLPARPCHVNVLVIDLTCWCCVPRLGAPRPPQHYLGSALGVPVTSVPWKLCCCLQNYIFFPLKSFKSNFLCLVM